MYLHSTLDFNFQNHIGAILQMGIHRCSRCAIAVAAEFCMLQKTVFRNFLLKLFTGQEKVMDTVLFSFPWLACGGRNRKIHILLSAYLCQNRALAYAGRTGDNK